MFLSLNDYPFTKSLELYWKAIQLEALRIPRKAYISWPEHYLHGKGWYVFGLNRFGKFIEQNCQHCPITFKLLKTVPYLKTAGFSLLEPNTIIKPHKGRTKSIIRCHLGLVIPSQCAIKVAGVTKRWREGRCLVFDDTSEHEAWNNSQQQRIVLLIDTARSKIGIE